MVSAKQGNLMNSLHDEWAGRHAAQKQRAYRQLKTCFNLDAPAHFVHDGWPLVPPDRTLFRAQTPEFGGARDVPAAVGRGGAQTGEAPAVPVLLHTPLVAVGSKFFLFPQVFQFPRTLKRKAGAKEEERKNAEKNSSEMCVREMTSVARTLGHTRKAFVRE